MNKQIFLAELKQGLAGLPQEDIDERLAFYGEMIDDRMEEGLSEEEAVSAVGPVSEIAAQILAETPFAKLVQEKVKPTRTRRAWEIVLLILGSPFWVVLLATVAIIILAVYIVIWSVVIVLYSVDFAFAASSVTGILGSLTYLPSGGFAQAALFFGAGLVCAGITIYLFFAFNHVAKGVAILSKMILLGIKGCFVRKEDAQ